MTQSPAPLSATSGPRLIWGWGGVAPAVVTAAVLGAALVLSVPAWLAVSALVVVAGDQR